MSAIETATLPMMLTELRLPTIKRLWAELAAQSNREGWTAERLLHTLLGHEMAERETRRLAQPGRSPGRGGAGEIRNAESGHGEEACAAEHEVAPVHVCLSLSAPAIATAERPFVFVRQFREHPIIS